MIWSGALALLVGAVLAVAVPGHVGDVEVGTIGVVTMIVGAVLLVVGIFGLNRGRRRRPVARVQDRVYRTSKGKMIAMIIAVIYIVSPIDFIPDVFVPVGIVDDATAFTWLVFAIGQELSRRRGQAA